MGEPALTIEGVRQSIGMQLSDARLLVGGDVSGATGMSMVFLLLAVDVAWPSYYGRKYLGSERGFGAAIA